MPTAAFRTRAAIGRQAGTVAEILRSAGYSTLCVGKWHVAPIDQTSAGGPYDQWPLGRGFERFYGFLDALTDHFYPDLVYDNHRVDPPATPQEGYHLTTDLVDHAIRFVRDQVSTRATSRSSSTFRWARRTARIRRRNASSRSTGAASMKAGTRSANTAMSASSNSASFRRARSWRRAIQVCRWDSLSDDEKLVSAGCRRRSRRWSITPITSWAAFAELDAIGRSTTPCSS